MVDILWMVVWLAVSVSVAIGVWCGTRWVMIGRVGPKPEKKTEHVPKAVLLDKLPEKCPKCSGTATRFHAAFHTPDYSKRGWKRGKLYPEHLTHSCWNCGYKVETDVIK